MEPSQPVNRIKALSTTYLLYTYGLVVKQNNRLALSADLCLLVVTAATGSDGGRFLVC